jgi:geranylgeranyl pyrophosphate synthase
LPEGNELIAIPAFATVNEDLERVESKMRLALSSNNEYLSQVLLYLLQSGGKRLRPALALLSAQFRPSDASKAVSLAAAVEILHTATLVHDDLIDSSLMRRGKATLNARWSSGATVLAGDYMFAWAASLAAETENVRVISIFAQTLVTICRGELNQLFGPNWQEQTQDDYYARIYNKTASLFASAAEAGAVLCGLPEPHVQSLRAYGKNLGMAFQIVDDLLDFVGDAHELGKPVGSDLRQGIVTLPTMLFLRCYPDDPGLTRVLTRQETEQTAIVQVVNRIAESDATSLAFEEARTFVRNAKEALLALPDHASRQAMLELADYVVDRRV